MMRQELIRKKEALVNVNMADYHAAKARKRQDTYIQSLEKRINKLETTVEELCDIVANCKRDS